MTVIAKSDQCAALVPLWRRVLGQVAGHLRQQGAHPARTVVLVPYAQLMPWAQRYWALFHADGFAPRFETTRNWARQLAAFVPMGDDLAGDVARDTLTARALLDRAGLSAQRDVLAAPLQEAAAQLATVVAAVPPAQRPAWAAHARGLLPEADGASALRFEAVVARIALEWVLASRHATDVLFEAGVRESVDALVVLHGFQAEPLAQALQNHWGDKATALALPPGPGDPGPMGRVALHAAQDAEDEAQRAAACVLAHVAAGRTPVALAANDRALTRRIGAHLASSGVAVRDENGWTLSTTRAAAQLMAALKACAWDAHADEVLDWLKHAPAVAAPALDALERALRKAPVANWAGAAQRDWSGKPALAQCVALAQGWREGLRAPRPLAQWLQALRLLLQASGQWAQLEADDAGARVLAALRLQAGQEAELDGWDSAGRPMALAEFTRWASEVCEAARYVPALAGDAPVVVLPLPQLLARPFAALVLPGCDEKRLQSSPEPTGDWTTAQREAWGLPTRGSLEAAQRAAWHYALQTPEVDVLWRTGDEGGEPLLASALVLALHLDGAARPGTDGRLARTVPTAPTPRPGPDGSALPVQRLSSTAYSDLRHCPYRFFALRQLGLQEADELAAEVDKRDFGNWLHAVLQHFHEALLAEPTDDAGARAARMDSAAQAVTLEQGLGEGDFLPFAAGWPQVRDGYLRWLAQHEQAGGHFRQAEVQTRQPLGALQLVGTIDRIDAVSSTGEPMPLVIDYKTESDTVTRKRIGAGAEDTQLAFYAALLSHDTLRAAYVNVGERGETQMHEQEEVVHLRDLLVEGIQHDFERIAAGDPMPALGEGMVCDYCVARGLCRKDFWE
ncbi:MULTISPECIES: PD-(D/E)XK nuclease family protein [unclassified Acidovorax]|uniref:PD-(D/E)XK nuclease family protein n=1 Tax=unclassified Acidovorax TaxID=2684926 RepID=UPI001C43F6BA|nr:MULTISPECIES: PD-(D/E)XK nuclease family protein [unclassified Acidovorax]MBV7431187.1 PD-(D/E)XK nuclease family protein [Acidovorax sp. sif0732]MBV7452293.1 PD-(D/E)XK nuclease family protein [Acidovorax sp. sif0715]